MNILCSIPGPYVAVNAPNDGQRVVGAVMLGTGLSDIFHNLKEKEVP